MLLIHFRKKREKMMEYEMLALTAPVERAEGVKVLVEEYRHLLFPGKQEDSFLEAAKKAIAEEAQKVYIVTPYSKLQAKAKQQAMENFSNAAAMNPELQGAFREEQRKHSIEGARRGVYMPSRPIPPDAVKM